MAAGIKFVLVVVPAMTGQPMDAPIPAFPTEAACQHAAHVATTDPQYKDQVKHAACEKRRD